MPNYKDTVAGHEFGSVEITIGANTYFTIGGINFDDPSNTIDIQGEEDEYTGWIATDGIVTGSATLDLAGQDVPAKYATFTWESVTWVIISVGKQLSVGALAQCPITFRKRINTPA